MYPTTDPDQVHEYLLIGGKYFLLQQRNEKKYPFHKDIVRCYSRKSTNQY